MVLSPRPRTTLGQSTGGASPVLRTSQRRSACRRWAWCTRLNRTQGAPAATRCCEVPLTGSVCKNPAHAVGFGALRNPRLKPTPSGSSRPESAQQAAVSCKGRSDCRRNARIGAQPQPGTSHLQRWFRLAKLVRTLFFEVSSPRLSDLSTVSPFIAASLSCCHVSMFCGSTGSSEKSGSRRPCRLTCHMVNSASALSTCKIDLHTASFGYSSLTRRQGWSLKKCSLQLGPSVQAPGTSWAGARLGSMWKKLEKSKSEPSSSKFTAAAGSRVAATRTVRATSGKGCFAAA